MKKAVGVEIHRTIFVESGNMGITNLLKRLLNLLRVKVDILEVEVSR